MKITICGSTTFKEKMLEYSEKLSQLGHEAVMHPDYRAFVNGEKSDIWHRLTHGEHAEIKREQGYMKWYYNAIQSSDGVLILNFTKNDISNYIGGNVFLEMGFAYVLKKKIYLLNPIPTIPYYDTEIKAMRPVVLHGDLSKIR